MNRQLAEEFNRSLRLALTNITKSMNIDSYNIGTIRYDSNNLTVTVKAMVCDTDASGKKISKEETEWNMHCAKFGFLKEDRGLIVKYQGFRYRLVSINPKRRKYPFILRNLATGINHKFRESCAREVILEAKKKQAKELTSSKKEPQNLKRPVPDSEISLPLKKIKADSGDDSDEWSSTDDIPLAHMIKREPKPQKSSTCNLFLLS